MKSKLGLAYACVLSIIALWVENGSGGLFETFIHEEKTSFFKIKVNI
ncbi:hypothetical protein [Brevibacillus sp. H7]